MLQDILRGMTPNEAREAERAMHTASWSAWVAQSQGDRDQATRLAETALRYRATSSTRIRRRYRRPRRRLTGTVSPVFGDQLGAGMHGARRKRDAASGFRCWPCSPVTPQETGTLCIGRAKKRDISRKASDVPKTTAADPLRDPQTVYDAGTSADSAGRSRRPARWAAARTVATTRKARRGTAGSPATAIPPRDKEPAHRAPGGQGLSRPHRQGRAPLERAGCRCCARRGPSK